jgi:hypothetical protein
MSEHAKPIPAKPIRTKPTAEAEQAMVRSVIDAYSRLLNRDEATDDEPAANKAMKTILRSVYPSMSRLQLLRVEFDSWGDVPDAWRCFHTWCCNNGHPQWEQHITTANDKRDGVNNSKTKRKYTREFEPEQAGSKVVARAPPRAPPAPMRPVVPPADGALTTQLLQAYLDENELVLEAIAANVNDHNVGDALAYQRKLQENLLYLASLVDIQSGNEVQQAE